MKLQEFTARIIGLQNKLYRFALRLTGQGAEAQDVVQEVMLRIWDKRAERARFDNLEAFCMRMAKNICIDKMRSKQSGHLDLDKIPEMVEAQNPLEITSYHDTYQHIQNIVSRLSARQKMVLQLRDVEEMSYQEIADMLDISLAQVKVNLFRARHQIREQLIEIEQYGLQNYQR